MRRGAAVLVLVVAACSSGSGEEEAPPAWSDALPARTVDVRTGELVWAVVPEPGHETAKLALYSVAAVGGPVASLSDPIGNLFADVPGALIHRLDEPRGDAAVEVGTVVLGAGPDGPVVGRVAVVENGRVSVSHDWNGRTVTSVVDGVVPLATGDGYVFRYLTLGAGRGLCFAESGDRVWVRDDSGFVGVFNKTEVETLPVPPVELQPGTAVEAYRWGLGYRSGTVVEVLEPGLRYRVEIQEQETRSFFFTELR